MLNRIDINQFASRHPELALIIFWLIMTPIFVLVEVPLIIFENLRLAWIELSLTDGIKSSFRDMTRVHKILMANINEARGERENNGRRHR